MSLLFNPDADTQSLKLFPHLSRHSASQWVSHSISRPLLGTEARQPSGSEQVCLHPGSATYQLCDLGQVIHQRQHSRITQSSDAAYHGR